MIKASLLSLFFIFISCSLQQKRNPASYSICDDVYNGNFRTQNSLSKEEGLVDHFFLKNPDQTDGVKYQINFERVESFVESLPSKYNNELTVTSIGQYDGIAVKRIDIAGWGQSEKTKVIITAGVHGNESAGVATVVNVLERIIHDPYIRTNFDFVIFPYLNPRGLTDNMRRLGNNIDLNRTFPGGKSPQQKITEMVRNNLKDESFDLGLDLHEAPFREHFFVIKMHENDNGLTSAVLADVPQEALVTAKDNIYPGAMYQASKPGEPPLKNPKKVYTLYAPGEVSSANRGTVKGFFHDELKVENAYTIEAPGQYELAEKIEIYTDIVQGYLFQFKK